MAGLDSPMHLLIIAIIALIVLGPKRLPATGRALGNGIREFKDALTSRFDADDDRRDASSVGPSAADAPPTSAAETQRDPGRPDGSR